MPDALTGLATRAELTQSLAASPPAAGRLWFLIHLNLGNFRIVNELYGPAAGDRHLADVAAALRGTLSATARAAHLWADEFVVAVDCDSPGAAFELAEALRRCVVGIPFTRDGEPLYLTASVGLAVLRPGDDPEPAFAAAAVACGVAQRTGRNRIHLYDESADDLTRARRMLAGALQLRRMLAQDELEIFAQPIVRVREPARPAKLEILLRLPAGGPGTTPEFLVASAERFHLMPALDRYVFEHALDWLKRTPRVLDTLESVSINLSGQSIVDRDFVDELFRQCRFGGVDPRKLCFEITETAAVASLLHTRELLRSLKELGCRFSLDDFGAGLCSFGYLRTLDVDEVKIDGQFVRQMGSDPVAAEMVRAIHQIAKATGKKTIGEFVQDEATLAQLRDIGVDYAQGWLFAQALPLREVERYLQVAGAPISRSASD